MHVLELLNLFKLQFILNLQRYSDFYSPIYMNKMIIWEKPLASSTKNLHATPFDIFVAFESSRTVVF